MEENNLSLRPTTLSEYIGQTKLKKNLEIYINAARAREETLDHVLFFGPPGLGKTTLAAVIASEMGGKLVTVAGPSLKAIGDLAAILSSLNPGDILFIDEIHRIPRNIEEMLYSAMEDFTLSILTGKDTTARALDITINPFTLVGATTRSGDLSTPLHDRFGIKALFDYYTIDDLSLIVKRTSSVFQTEIDEDAVLEIAKRARGTPRIANRIFRRVRDFATNLNKKTIDLEATKIALEAMEIDDSGLDVVDNKYLKIIIERYNGGPVGIDALAATIGEEEDTIVDVYEPYLLKVGYIHRSPRGRLVTELGRAYYLEKILKDDTIIS